MDVLEAPLALLETAKSRTRKLTPVERRVVLGYLEEQPHLIQSNYELAAMLQVDEKTIRKDRQQIFREYTKSITPENGLLFVGKFLRSHDDLIKRTWEGLEKAHAGTLGHQNYVRLLSELEGKRMKMLQEIGAVPKELGRLNVVEERWIATVTEDGVTSVSKAHAALPPASIEVDNETLN